MKKSAEVKRSSTPSPKTKEFSIPVVPDKRHLEHSIAQGGNCNPKECWHKVAIAERMLAIDPAGQHRVRVDAGIVHLNYKGYRYWAKTPHHVKISLMRFDREQYEALRVRPYVLTFHRDTRIAPTPPERQEQINKARRLRIKAGGDENRRNYVSMRQRSVGHSSIV